MNRIPLNRAIIKPEMFMGCEKIPFLLVAGTSGLLVMGGNLWLKIAGVAYFVLLVGIIALFNSQDIFMFRILWRYQKYQNFYPSNALYPGRPDTPENF